MPRPAPRVAPATIATLPARAPSLRPDAVVIVAITLILPDEPLGAPRHKRQSGHPRSRYWGLVTDPWVEPRVRAFGRHGCRLLKRCGTGRGAVVTRFLGANRLNGASGRELSRKAGRSGPRQRLGTDRAQIAVAEVDPSRPNGLTRSTSASSRLARSAKRSVGDVVSRTKVPDPARRPLTYLPEPADLTSRRPDLSSRPTRSSQDPDIENVGDQMAPSCPPRSRRVRSRAWDGWGSSGCRRNRSHPTTSASTSPRRRVS